MVDGAKSRETVSINHQPKTINGSSFQIPAWLGFRHECAARRNNYGLQPEKQGRCCSAPNPFPRTSPNEVVDAPAKCAYTRRLP